MLGWEVPNKGREEGFQKLKIRFALHLAKSIFNPAATHVSLQSLQIHSLRLRDLRSCCQVNKGKCLADDIEGEGMDFINSNSS